MKYLVMIQARCGSVRLPNKVLMDLCGKPALQRMIERVQQSELIDEVIIITSIDKNNLPILELCSKLGVRAGVGSENDVLDRYYQTAKLLNPEYVIRLTADCPCFDAGLLDEAIRELKPDTDYCAMLSETFADGLDLEIMKYEALKLAWKESNMSHQREHVTSYIIEHPEKFKHQDFISPIGNFGDQRWTVDEPEDFELVSRIYDHFIKEEGTEAFGYQDILKYLDENPELKAINSKFTRNEGYEKSLMEDKVVMPE